MTLEERLDIASEYLKTQFQINAPKRTWNLTFNGIHRINDCGIWTIVIGGEPAPYAVFTNESWNAKEISYTTDKLFGKKVAPYQVHYTHSSHNPNEHWIQKTIEDNIDVLKTLLSGSCTQDEIDEIKSKTVADQMILNFQAQVRIDGIEKQIARLKGESK